MITCEVCGLEKDCTDVQIQVNGHTLFEKSPFKYKWKFTHFCFDCLDEVMDGIANVAGPENSSREPSHKLTTLA